MSNKNGEIIIYGKFKSGAKDGSVADMSQIKGLPDALNTKADKTELTSKADKTEIPQFVYAAKEDAVPEDRDSRTVYLVGELETFKFNITLYRDGIISRVFQYDAEEGMTWGEWINSEYNIDGYRIYDSDYSRICTSEGYLISYETVHRVVAQDAITTDLHYEYNVGGGSND